MLLISNFVTFTKFSHLCKSIIFACLATLSCAWIGSSVSLCLGGAARLLWTPSRERISLNQGCLSVATRRSTIVTYSCFITPTHIDKCIVSGPAGGTQRKITTAALSINSQLTLHRPTTDERCFFHNGMTALDRNRRNLTWTTRTVWCIQEWKLF